MADLHNNQLSGTSAGLTPGTSSKPPRWLSFAARQADLRALAPRQPVLDGCVGVTAVREFEFSQAQTHAERVARACNAPRVPSRAERGADAERLRRV